MRHVCHFQLDEVADYLDDYHEEGVRAGYEWVKGTKTNVTLD